MTATTPDPSAHSPVASPVASPVTSPVACTIVANNYLAYARVLAESFLRHNPGGRFVTLIVDEPHESIRYDREPFEVVFCRDLGFESWQDMAFRYSILELSTAVKPLFLSTLLARHDVDGVCYFDPDIEIFSPLEELYGVLSRSNVVLTPHILQPIADGKTPGELNFLQSGTYNLGFVGVRDSQETLRFLGWWDERLRVNCVHEIEKGLFVDQKWCDLAPALFEGVTVLRDSAYNVAYWNLQERKLERSGSDWTVDRGPLRFFHFSGVDQSNVDAISKYQDRYTLDDLPHLRELFESYGQQLEDHEHLSIKQTPYAYSSFDDGSGIPEIVRRIYRERVGGHGIQASDSSPFSASGGFRRWLAQPAETGGLPNLMVELRALRPDLQSVYPDIEGADRPKYEQWFRATAPDLIGLSAELKDEVVAQLDLQEGPGGMPEPSVGDESIREPAEPARVLASQSLAGNGQRTNIPREALELYETRSDLQESFPDPLGRDRGRFAYWIAVDGDTTAEIDPVLVAKVRRSLPLRARLSSLLRRQRRRFGV